MKRMMTLLVVVASAALASQTQAQQRSPGDWWRVGESRLGAVERGQKFRPQVRGFRGERDRNFDPQVRYDFAGRGLPDWAARAFQPSNRR